MPLTEKQKIKHVGITTAIGFIGSVVAFGIALFFPPDLSQIPPFYPEPELVCIEISMAMYIFGCTVIGLKLAEEKKTLPAAGFTMMAISQGIIFVLNFMSFNSTAGMAEGYKTYCGSFYLLLPAMILIAFYSDYPRWVNLLGIVSCVPLIAVYYIFMKSASYSVILDELSFFSMILFNITALAWGIYALRNMRRDLNQQEEINKIV